MELAATRYECTSNGWDFVISKTTMGWTAVCYPHGTTRIPPIGKLFTESGWQPILNQTGNTRYFVDIDYAVTEIESKIDEIG